VVAKVLFNLNHTFVRIFVGLYGCATIGFCILFAGVAGICALKDDTGVQQQILSAPKASCHLRNANVSYPGTIDFG
jgi:hypothetical protein